MVAPRVKASKGAVRSDPCTHCVKSALSGKSTGECWGVTGSSSNKCWLCYKHNRKDCSETPVAAHAIIRAMVQARKLDEHSAASSNYTIAVKLAISLAAETEADVLAAAGIDGAGGQQRPALSADARASLLAKVDAVRAEIDAMP